MKKLLLALVACGASALAAQAQDTPVVVELFTSQGCSSCPPADEMMEVLASREDVIALSLHVDYWDYIGWKDEFADPKHAKRQRAYAAFANRRSVYTPEMIVNGVTDIVGAKPMKLATAIEEHKKQPDVVEVSVSVTGTRMQIEARALKSGLGPVVVQLIRYQPERVADIRRGENAGKTITYINVAQDLTVIGEWDGVDVLRMSSDLIGVLPAVVLLQSPEYGRIFAAARVPY